MRRLPWRPAWWSAVWALMLSAGTAGGHALEYVPVGDPIEAELRLLEVAGLDSATARRIRLPHGGLRPRQWVELQGAGPPVEPASAAALIAVARIERALGRDAGESFAPHPEWRSTPRLFEAGAAGARIELSVGADGAAVWDDATRDVASGTGVRGIFGVTVDRWLYHSDLFLGEIAGARRFADPVVKDSDVILHTEDTWLAWSAEDARWSVQFGRSRWHWGPGDEASLVLSRTSAALTGFAYRVRIPALRADVSALSATLDTRAGEQLAAHRLEWQPLDALRFGVTETARYQASMWQPLYLVGAIPYVLVQRLQAQDEPDSTPSLRNNVQMAADVAWRVAPGTRVYGELLVDDLHARTASIPNKLAWQVGWEGAGSIGRHRLTWGGELTRLSRYVYTSFFGRDYAAQGAPLGFPTGPDARRLRVRIGWDPSPDAQLFAHVAVTDRGENGLDEPFQPGVSPARPRIWSFEGTAERTREIEAGARWWPASGIDVAASAGWRWREDADHVPGAEDDGPLARIAWRLRR
jgi:hypothetical protein